MLRYSVGTGFFPVGFDILMNIVWIILLFGLNYIMHNKTFLKRFSGGKGNKKWKQKKRKKI
jgi:hypothetical protein